jgi:hypothetical protein
MVRAGKGRWSPKAEKTFLLYLEGTANVRRAAEAAGFSTTALYYRKRRDPAFAARWDEIEGRGTARLNSFLVEAGLASFDPESADEELPKVSVAEAIAIVKLKGGNGQGPARGSRRRGLPEPPIEEVRDEVLRRIAAIRRQREKAAEAAYPSPSSD